MSELHSPHTLRILYVSPSLPVANGTGGQKRSCVAVEALSELGDVFYLSAPPSSPFEDNAEQPQNGAAELVRATLSGNALQANAPKVWKNFFEQSLRKRLFSAWITAGEMSAPSHKQASSLTAAIQHAFGKAPFDVIYVYQAHAGAFILPCIQPLLAKHGVFLVDWDAAERLAVGDQYRMRRTGFIGAITRGLNDLKLRLHEARLFKAANVTLCSSGYDVPYFVSRTGADRICAIPNCINIPTGDVVGRSSGTTPNVLFVGLINYWPNRQGLLLFLNEIWPVVRAAIPEATFTIVGRGVTPDVLDWHCKNGIRIIGDVDHVGPCYQDCDVAVAPMQFSVGSSIKILESLAYKRPMVAFEAATRRHALLHEKHVMVANTPAEFARQLIHLLKNPVQARLMANEGHAFVAENYSREHAKQLTVRLLKEALAKREHG